MSAEWQKGTGNFRFPLCIGDLTASHSINANAVFALANRRRSVIFITISIRRTSE
jgi:hypothetical protein